MNRAERIASNLIVQFVELNDHYLDVGLCDTSANTNLRSWRVTYDTREHCYYACLMRAETQDSPFDIDVRLPRGLVDQLWRKAIPTVAKWLLLYNKVETGH